MATTNNITVTGSSLTTSGAAPVVTAQSQQSNIASALTQPIIETNDFDSKINVQITGLGGGVAPDTSVLIGLNGEIVTYTLFFNYPRLSIVQKATTADAIQSFRVGKGQQDTANTQEQVQKYLRAGRLDTVVRSDTILKSLSKQFAHTFIKSDVIVLRTGKGVADLVTKSDQTRITVAKVLNHVTTSTDQFARIVAYNRTFTDTVDATDDFLGAANIDDDQIARVGKVVVDSATSLDVKAVTVGINKQETTNTQDQKIIVVRKNIVDTVPHTDQIKLSSAKVVLDTSNILDIASKNTGKIFADTFTRTEEVRNRIQKGVVDTGIISEQKQLSVSKVFADNISKQDIVTITWSAIRNFADQSNSADLAEFAIKPVKFDQANTLDTNYITVNKNLVDFETTSDLVSTQVSYNRTFTDVIDATDDFFGNANVDDDQTARVNKVAVDYATTNDPIQFSASKVFTDLAQAQDTPNITTTKVFFDTFAKSDQIRLTPEKVVLDVNNISDTSNKSTEKVSVEVVANTDLVDKLINKVAVDSASANDNIKYIYIDKNVLDNSVVADTTYLQLDKSFLEFNIVSDTTLLNSNKAVREIVLKSDVSYADITKPVIDSVLKSDAASLELIKPVADAVVNTESQTISIGKAVADTVTMSDLIIISSLLRKVLEDSIDATDDFFGAANIDDDQVARVNKVLTDYALTIETLEFSSVKSIIDVAAIQNPAAIELTKPFTDSFVRSDVNYIQVLQVSQETLVNSDSSYRDVSKAIVDTAINSDSNVIVVGKDVVDTTTILDTEPVFIFDNNSTDSTLTTDTKIAVIGKNVIDYSANTDTISFSASTKVFDSVLIDNPISLQPTKIFTELNTTSELTYFDANKTIEDTAINLETISKDTAKPFTDIAINTDSAAKNISIPKYETTNISETVQLLANFNPSFTDTIDATDDFLGAANIDDDQIARVGKNTTDYATIADPKQLAIAVVKADIATSMDMPYKRTGKSATSETARATDVLTFFKFTNRPLIELGDVSDSGRINWQDYCDPDILDPRYVGQERIFSYN
jgi:hypothetical protein